MEQWPHVKCMTIITIIQLCVFLCIDWLLVHANFTTKHAHFPPKRYGTNYLI
jgi:hypothetical protein